MSETCNVTATLNNQTDYVLNYVSQNTVWGNGAAISGASVCPGASLQIFYAHGAQGTATGCQGTVLYQFTDQNGIAQSVTLAYADPFSGSHSFSATVPSGCAPPTTAARKAAASRSPIT